MREPINKDLPNSAHTRFKALDRVVRRADVFNPDSPLLHGRVVRVYEQTIPKRRDRERDFYPEMYDVIWNERDERGIGYLPEGLDLDPEWSGWQKGDR
jgi:hypothetical protein